MKESKKPYPLSRFSHIYIEERAMEYPFTQILMDRFPKSTRVFIRHYKDVFNRPHQDFNRQKESPKIIVAVKEEPYLYEGPEVCEDFGNRNFYYASTLLNCIYHCDYCYLQGLYPSANIVAFVNMEGFFGEVQDKLAQGPLYLCTSYDTDLLAFEGVLPYASRWIEFARQHRGLIMEIRTKSANYRSVHHLQPTDHVILAWSLSPDEIARQYERLAPGLEARLSAAKAAIESGWKVRLCLEPVIKVKGWQQVYRRFIEKVFNTLRPEGIHDMNIGVFRMNRDYYKKIAKTRTDTDIFCYAMECRDGVVSYGDEEDIKAFLHKKITAYFPEERLYV